MSIEAVVVVVAISIPFILFAVVLYWAERQTRSLSH
jgi:hypothetical protein